MLRFVLKVFFLTFYVFAEDSASSPFRIVLNWLPKHNAKKAKHK